MGDMSFRTKMDQKVLCAEDFKSDEAVLGLDDVDCLLDEIESRVKEIQEEINIKGCFPDLNKIAKLVDNLAKNLY